MNVTQLLSLSSRVPLGPAVPKLSPPPIAIDSNHVAGYHDRNRGALLFSYCAQGAGKTRFCLPITFSQRPAEQGSNGAVWCVLYSSASMFTLLCFFSRP